jgi:phospholipid/cholesterol/gamma-HCH transport system ATP-binding protein
MKASESAQSGAPILSFEDVRFGYDQRPILDGVSLSFKPGTVTALMGGSGCGKTTLLRLASGQVRAQAGDVLFEGNDVGKLKRNGLYQMRRRMGMLFQFGALFTDLSVFENVAFPLREHTDLEEDLIRDLVLMKLHSVGLRGAADLMPSEISGGMARRVALARAIALDPPLLLYDEPFAGLDPISLGTIAQLIRRLNDALGATSILVSHDVHESFEICDYIYVLGQGKVIGHGTPDELSNTDNPELDQFLNGKREGPVGFHYVAPNYASQLGLGKNDGGSQ